MSRDSRLPLVLVPGACLGGWAWREVARSLRRLGHDVYPLTLTGLGERAHLAERSVDLDSSPLPNGVAIRDVQSPEQREQQRHAIEQQGAGWRWPVPDRETLESGMFGSAGGLTEAHFAEITERGTPQPYATFTSPLQLREERPPAVRRAAVFCTAGGTNVALVRRLIEQKDPRAAVFAADDWEFHELPTGHWAMFSAPGALSELLHRIASPAGEAALAAGTLRA